MKEKVVSNTFRNKTNGSEAPIPWARVWAFSSTAKPKFLFFDKEKEIYYSVYYHVSL